jgi:hypothetical protein
MVCACGDEVTEQDSRPRLHDRVDAGIVRETSPQVFARIQMPDNPLRTPKWRVSRRRKLSGS